MSTYNGSAGWVNVLAKRAAWSTMLHPFNTPATSEPSEQPTVPRATSKVSWLKDSVGSRREAPTSTRTIDEFSSISPVSFDHPPLLLFNLQFIHVVEKHSLVKFEGKPTGVLMPRNCSVVETRMDRSTGCPNTDETTIPRPPTQ